MKSSICEAWSGPAYLGLTVDSSLSLGISEKEERGRLGNEGMGRGKLEECSLFLDLFHLLEMIQCFSYSDNVPLVEFIMYVVFLFAC